MRTINVKEIKKAVSDLCIKANTDLRPDVFSAIKKAAGLETDKRAKKIWGVLIENAAIAKRDRLAICQDTGIACVYLEIGRDVKLTGASLERAVNDGVKLGYRRGYFRASIVDPLTRKNTGNNAPAVIKTKIVNGDKVRLTVIPKGFGCENKNQIKMFKPTAGLKDVKKFIIDAVRQAGPDACPPYVVGVGIGGTFEKAAELSKEALLKTVSGVRCKVLSPECRLEKELLKEINKLKIGPAGIGGKTTALAVNICSHPTHIAGLPVAVSIGCHAMRSATAVI
ncbi:MAG: fumarate hydratase [Candidatus Omnitrophica bacterium]|nr:fumarate hydratase [Candidatus Omnitrophota bacterium]